MMMMISTQISGFWRHRLCLCADLDQHEVGGGAGTLNFETLCGYCGGI